MDTVRADHLSVYGYERDTSPNLRELAKQATVYTQAIAPGDMTLTSHASLFTGMYAAQHGTYPSIPDYSGGRPLTQSTPTMAEILLDKGYSTMAVVANTAFLTNYFGFDRGFQYYDQNSRPRFFELRTSRYLLKDVLREGILKIPLSVPWEWESKHRRAGEINREVFKLLDSQKVRGGRPFFLFVNYMDAHRPYVPPPPYDSLYPGKEMASFNQRSFDALKDQVISGRQTPTDGERQHLISQYDGGIAYIDAKIGELIAHLKQIGVYDYSVLIITSDHGEAFGEEDLFEHGCGVYQHQVHIPLLLVDPHNREGRVMSEPVSLVNLLPTVLDFTDAKNKGPRGMEERSLRKNPTEAGGYVITESYPIGWYEDYPRMRRIERAIISGSFKFVTSTLGKKELYDLSKDPDEKENLYSATDEISQRLESTMNQWIKTAPPKSSLSRKVDKNALENLKSLGYMK
ncbi:sulfatase, partial [Thermodesulfobacteriota bacterium]